MNQINDFVKEKRTSYTLKDCIKEYNEMEQGIKELEQIKEHYDILLNSNTSEKNLTFKEKYALYILIENAIRRKEKKQLGFDLVALQKKFKNLFDDLHEYLSLTEEIEIFEKRKSEIIHEYITFKHFDYKYFSEHCLFEHCFVLDDDELKCVYCGATTKDYQLSKEEFDFLVLCAKQRGLLLEEFTKEDWPLLKVEIEKQNYRRNLRPKKDIWDEDLSQEEDWFFVDAYESTELKVALQRAHMMDSEIYQNEEITLSNPQYLSTKKEQELLNSLEKEFEEIKKSNSRFKSLLIEQCQTAKYEILILAGNHIPTLYKEAKNEAQKVALIKAYYNISNFDFRKNSCYFDIEHTNDAITYDCYTANQEINNKILEMKKYKHNI